MTPLEIMAKTHWEANPDVPPWEALTPRNRAEDIARMRAALLALAEAELPEATMEQGESIRWRRADGETLSYLAMGEGFRAMLRAIAEDKPNDA